MDNALATAAQSGHRAHRLTPFSSWGVGLARRVLRTSPFLALLDQAVVSAGSLLLLVLLGRLGGAEQLGYYAFAISIFMVVLAIQEALITRPYTIRLPEHAASRADFAFETLAAAAMLAAVAGAGLSVFALAYAWALGPTDLVLILASLGCALPFMLLREFVRRHAFADLKFGLAAAFDVTIVLATIGAALLLLAFGSLSAASVIVTTGASCAAIVCMWLLANRSAFSWRALLLVHNAMENWRLGRWLLLGQLGVQVQGYAFPWLVMLYLGPSTAGALAACMTIVSFSNPMLQGFFNFLIPRYVRTLDANGKRELHRCAAADAALLAAAMASFSGMIYLFGADLLTFVFKGTAHPESRALLFILSLCALFAAVGAPASIALASAKQTKIAGTILATGAAASSLLMLLLLPQWGIVAAAYGLLMMEVAICVARWGAFYHCFRSNDV